MSSATIPGFRGQEARSSISAVSERLCFAEAGGEAEDGVVGDRDSCDPHADDRTHVRVFLAATEVG